MASFTSFEEIEAWQKARILTNRVYAISKRSPFSRDFALRDQLRKASVSIMANIAEGYERSGSKEFIQFLSIAKGSAGEVKSHLTVAFDQQYITEDEKKELHSLATDISKMVAGLIAYLQKTKIRGLKYKPPTSITRN